ncbi:gluconokinase [Pediococcus parvulus]|jgi:gluconokinase|uniref:gluconokinase n=1 Tax=Pediococcus parvulus TaxID=54062 RepID=UPI00070B1CDC|nr:gluconokinase [Pediococcus parvulus]MCT3027906.1 gluconate kinase [Pediococcus parvulus]MCT3031953.1 gluconate kinase [Pediococcus parvulus]MCT3034310.1 gluconate kinase [Pediococcus parvulus]GEL90236.1 gluconate kinase [Pediococcus parvulus]GHC05972.1 gluconate kinase [Pediococcus parvulus]
MQAIIGVDIGTTSTKVVLFDLKGTVLANQNNGYPLHQDQPSYAQENPEQIFAAVVTGIKKVMQIAKQKSWKVLGVSFSAAMHSLILIDGQDKPLTQVITWADNRSEKQSAELRENGLAQALYFKTGTPNHPMTPLTKIMWFREERPQLFAKTAKFIGIKDYIFFKLFGAYVIDEGLASATGMFNIQTMAWDAQALAIAGITTNQLPKLVSTETQFSGMSATMAAQLNLDTDVPFIIGSSDGALANLGVGATNSGQLAVSIGTSGAVRLVVDHPVFDPAGKLFCYVLGKDQWLVGGPVNNGGIVLQWVQEQWFTKDRQSSYVELIKLAAKSVPGAHGLIFLPYLGGERAPIWNADARGSFVGLTRQHTQADMIRAVLEGIVLNLCEVTQMIERVAGPIANVKATGGFSQSAFWVQILADCFNQTVTVSKKSAGSALGAAIMGLHSLEIVPKLALNELASTDQQKWQANPQNAECYQDLMKLWAQISEILEPEYHKIADFQSRYFK